MSFNIGDRVAALQKGIVDSEILSIHPDGNIFELKTPNGSIYVEEFYLKKLTLEDLITLSATKNKQTLEPAVGVKFDQHKAPMDLLPHEALEEIAKVLAFGEKKYSAGNWTGGIEMRRLISAAMRHIGQFNSGEDLDEESQTLHLANAACNLMFGIWMMKNRPDMDNRWSKKKK